MRSDANKSAKSAFCFVAALMLPVSGPAQTATSASPAGNVLAAREIPNVPRQDMGRRAADKEVEVRITLAFNREDELDQLIREQSNPGSPNYRHFLTYQQFSERFGPTVSQVAILRSNLEAAGFRITDIAPTQLLIRAVAPSASVERYFQTEMHTVNQAGYGERYVNVRPAVLPTPLTSIVKYLRLNNFFIGYRPMVRRVPMPREVSAAAKNSSRTAEGSVPVSPRTMTSKAPSALTGPLFDWGGGIGPVVIAKAFDFPVQHGCDAFGWNVAVIMGSDVSNSDLNSFYYKYQIPRRGNIYRVAVNGGAIGRVDPQVGLETALDVETICSLAPGASVILYIIPSSGGLMSDSDIDAAMQYVNYENNAPVVNLSLGGPESFDGTFWGAAKQATAQGITVCVASGDSGKAESPASNPYVVAVGGTNLTPYPDGTIYGDSVWNNPPAGSSGGGVSSIFYTPAFQGGTTGLASTTYRNVPDVAFAAQNASVWFQGNFMSNQGYEIDGTSWACPQFAALMIEAVAARYQRLGLVNQAIYRGFRSSGNRFIRDIVYGGNGTYNAKVGYDNCSGVGTPMGWNFIWYGL
jgi:kumamolisin